MVFTRARRRQIDGLRAIPRLVVVAFAFLAIAMANVIRVLLLEFVVVDVVLLCELTFPEPKRFIHSETNSFQEKTELQSAVMLEMMLVFKSSVECLHARRHVLPRVVVEVGETDFVLAGRCFWLEKIKVNGIVV